VILAVHIGNSLLEIGFFDRPQWTISRLSAHRGMTADDALLALHALSAMRGAPVSIEEAILSSVSPGLTPVLCEAIERYAGLRPLVVGPGVKTGLNIKINDPSELGADLVCLSAGVLAKYRPPILLVQAGSATTLSYLDAQGGFLGTIITAGTRHMLDSLVRHADLLNPVALRPPAKLLGTDSVESMQSGVLLGCAEMIDGLSRRIMAQHPVETAVMTGALADTLLPHCRTAFVKDDTLLFDGMAAILERQRKRS